MATAFLKYFETVVLMDCSFIVLVQHKNLLSFGILASSRQKGIIIIPQSTGTILDNTQETDVSEKRLVWNFNVQNATRKAKHQKGIKGRLYMSLNTDVCMCVHIVCTQIHIH